MPQPIAAMTWDELTDLMASLARVIDALDPLVPSQVQPIVNASTFMDAVHDEMEQRTAQNLANNANKLAPLSASLRDSRASLEALKAQLNQIKQAVDQVGRLAQAIGKVLPLLMAL